MLADSALAFTLKLASRRTIAQHYQITYLTPAGFGIGLVAEAGERMAATSGIYDVTITAARRSPCWPGRADPGTLVPT